MLKSLYYASPVWLQNAAISLYGYNLRRVRFGREFASAWEIFDRLQWRSPDEIRAYQDERLRVMIGHAYENVPYYRRVMDEHRLKPSDFKTQTDLPKLPLLQREVLKYDLDSLCARNIPRRRLFVGETSGTTGNPTTVYWDHGMVVANAVVEWRVKSWAGVHLGDPLAVVMVARSVVPPDQMKPPFWRFNRAVNQMLLSAFHMSEANLPHYVSALREFKPRALEAYPSTAVRLARYVLDHGLELHIPAVLTTSEALSGAHRDSLKRAFGCEVFDYYGMAERVIFATECEAHTGLHLNSDYGITELIDPHGEPTPAGQTGRLVGTSLHNLGMPMLRLVTTDTLAVGSRTCTCGRGFPLLDEFTGRIDDYLMTPDGRLLPATGLTVVTDPLSRLAESQVVQEEPGRILVKIVKGQGYLEDDTRALLDGFRRILGPDMKIELQFVDEIPRTVGGKHRWIVSSVRWDQ